MIKQEAEINLQQGFGLGVDVNMEMLFGYDKAKNDKSPPINKITQDKLLYAPTLYLEWNGINDITLFFGVSYYKLSLQLNVL